MPKTGIYCNIQQGATFHIGYIDVNGKNRENASLSFWGHLLVLNLIQYHISIQNFKDMVEPLCGCAVWLQDSPKKTSHKQKNIKKEHYAIKSLID